ncbi:hypothetical protein [Actinoallomurus iriomotensis]|nr:hypothetical protein [Actinoallomurus iriomotensis]
MTTTEIEWNTRGAEDTDTTPFDTRPARMDVDAETRSGEPGIPE